MDVSWSNVGDNGVEALVQNVERWVLKQSILNDCCASNSYWTSRKNSLELIELSSVNKVSLV